MEMDIYVVIEKGEHPKYVVQYNRLPDTEEAQVIISDYYFFNDPDSKQLFDRFFEELDYSDVSLNVSGVDVVNIEVVDV